MVNVCKNTDVPNILGVRLKCDEARGWDGGHFARDLSSFGLIRGKKTRRAPAHHAEECELDLSLQLSRFELGRVRNPAPNLKAES